MPRKHPQRKRSEAKSINGSSSALSRLKARCPFGPPYLVLVLDQESVEALTLGSVNSRVHVEACRALAAVQPVPLPKDYPA